MSKRRGSIEIMGEILTSLYKSPLAMKFTGLRIQLNLGQKSLLKYLEILEDKKLVSKFVVTSPIKLTMPDNKTHYRLTWRALEYITVYGQLKKRLDL